MTPQDPYWNMDTGASSHLANNTCIFTSFSNSSMYPSVFVDNGHSIPVTHIRHSFLHTSSKPLQLNHILETPHIIKNLISVSQFTRDNDVSVEFDAYGFSVKNYQIGRVLLRCDSTTWVLVPRLAKVNVVRSMWLFKHKFNADGSLSRYKASLVANGRSQQQGPYSAATLFGGVTTFSPVVKPATIHTVLSHSVFRDWLIHQLDVKNAFPHAVFVHRGSDIAYLLLYVDDIILTASSSAFLQRIIASIHSEFAMTDLGLLNYFLGIFAQRSASGLFLSQSRFAEEILERAHMQNCNPCQTPVDI
nr:putative reverse transcriptase [Tanacetum cinerariifolium]